MICCQCLDAERSKEDAATSSSFGYNGKYPEQRAEITYDIGDSEAASFAASITDALTRAHWHVKPHPPEIVASLLPPPTGVAIQGGVDDESIAAIKPQRELLIKLLNDAGFDAGPAFTWKVVRLTPEERQTIAISVKHRPEGLQGEYKLQAEREQKKSTSSSPNN